MVTNSGHSSASSKLSAAAAALSPPERAALLEAIRAELARRDAAEAERRATFRYADDPCGFVHNVLREFLWSRQRQIAEAVRDHRRVAVPSCHGAGKSFLASRVTAWWLGTNPPGDAFVVTSAPTFNQVRAILWREINRAHKRGGLPGHTNQTEWHIDGELVAFGRKPQDMDMTGFQGIHARRVLVILDEACGIPKTLWDAAETLVTNDESRLFAIGNPDDPSSEFARKCAPGSGFKVIPISAFDTPNLTGEAIPEGLRPLLVGATWVEEMAANWGRESPLYTAKILGEFPDLSDDTLIPMSWLKRAVNREGTVPGDPVALGCDIARYGTDETVIIERRGDVARLAQTHRGRDLMETTGHIARLLRDTGASVANVDDAGLGGGVTDRLKEQRLPVRPINVGAAAQEPDKYVNLRAEVFWNLRERFREGTISLPEDDTLLTQLGAIRYRIDSRGRVVIESKDEMKKRGLPSPDRADALALAFAPIITRPQPRIRML